MFDMFEIEHFAENKREVEVVVLNERQNGILAFLEQEGRASVKKLAEHFFVSEMTIHGQPFDTRPLRDAADRRKCRPDFAMQRHHRLDDPLLRLGLPLGALLQFVLSLRHCVNIAVH